MDSIEITDENCLEAIENLREEAYEHTGREMDFEQAAAILLDYY